MIARSVSSLPSLRRYWTANECRIRCAFALPRVLATGYIRSSMTASADIPVIKVAKRTIQRYMCHARPRRPHRQTWATFVHNHAQDIWACDVLQVHDVFFRPLFAFVITELGSRRILHVTVTRSPTDEWVAQHLREATPFGRAPTYLIRDNDAKYGSLFDAVAVGSGIEVRRTPIKAPRANAI